METELTVVKIDPFKNPEILTIPNTLDALQGLVDGYIQVIPLKSIGDINLALIVNEEAHLKGMQPNRFLSGNLILGPIVITTVNRDDPSEFTSFTRDEAVIVKECFRIPALELLHDITPDDQK